MLRLNTLVNIAKVTLNPKGFRFLPAAIKAKHKTDIPLYFQKQVQLCFFNKCQHYNMCFNKAEKIHRDNYTVA